MRLQFSLAAAVLALSSLSWDIDAFAPMMRNSFHVSKSSFTSSSTSTSHHPSVLFAAGGGNLFRPTKHNNNDDEDDEEVEEDDEDDDDEEESLYEQFATSEFLDNETSSQITTTATSNTDWGGEYNTLRSRFEDQKNNKVGPSRALFRTMTTQTPNEAIMSFISGANPQVVTAMSGAVKSLLGGLTNPGAGIETIVKANGEKLGTLCFQLQMTGYMFRNAEYVLAIRDLMNIQGSATFDEYKIAFDKLDKDGSGFIEVDEIDQLLTEVYDGETPAVEIEAFLQFFDVNNDGKISWEEFERGLGIVADTKAKESRKRKGRLALPADINMVNDEDDDEEEDDDDDDEYDLGEPNISGKIQIEMQNGKVIEVEAKEYIEELKKEAAALKAALSREKSPQGQPQQNLSPMDIGEPPLDESGGIAGYIASLQGDIQSLTKGISPEVVDAMKMLVDFVLDGGPSGKGKGRKNNKELEMEIPGSALQQLALWQLVLGYKLREAEATGEYRKMLE